MCRSLRDYSDREFLVCLACLCEGERVGKEGGGIEEMFHALISFYTMYVARGVSRPIKLSETKTRGRLETSLLEGGQACV